MSVNQVNNFIEHHLPTIVKVMEGETWQKVAFVFLSVLTGGILPLGIAVYDFTSVLIRDFKTEKNDPPKNLDFRNVKIPLNKPKAGLIAGFLNNHKKTLLVSAVALALLSGCSYKIESLTSVKDALMLARESLISTSNLFFEKTSNLINDNPKIFAGALASSLAMYVVGNRSQRDVEKEEFEELVDPPSSPTSKDFLRAQAYAPSAPSAPGSMYPSLSGLNSLPEGY